MQNTNRLKLAWSILWHHKSIPVSRDQVAKRLCELEQGKRQLDIAQATEVANVLPALLREMNPVDLMEWVYKAE